MIPKTVVELFSFLLLVAPGVGYELLRERRAPKRDQTAFRELSRVALYSFWFSFLSCAAIALLRIPFGTALFDPAKYLSDKEYLKSHYTAVVWTVTLEVLIAFALVVVAYLIKAAGLLSRLYAKIYSRLPKSVQELFSTNIRQNGLWFQLFEETAKQKEAILSIRLSDGSRMSGYFHGCTAYDTFENAEIAIKMGKKSKMWMLDRQDSNGQQEPYTQEPEEIDDDIIWVRGEDISYIKVRYKNKPLVPRGPKKNP